jgi:L-asparaginase II
MANQIGEVLAELTRNGLVESRHAGHLVILNADGSIDLSKGDINAPVFPRSSVKVIQASAMVRSGLKLPPEQLALVCSSHSGSALHQDTVLKILSSANLTESDLQCAFDKPLGEKERIAWGAKEATRLAMNCSGKHAGMLATCVAAGWDTKSYLNLDHPLQLAYLKELEELAGEKVSNSTFDGCGAPLFAISLLGLAKAIQKVTLSKDPVHTEIMNACRANPAMMTGEDRKETKLMKQVAGLFMKDGAEGVEVMSLPDGRTAVLKISDGSPRAIQTIAGAILKRWGIDVAIEQVPTYAAGNVVGGIRATL